MMNNAKGSFQVPANMDNANGSFKVPAKILNANDTLTVSWSGVKDATIGDAVNIYTVPINSAVPVSDDNQYKSIIGFQKVFEFDSNLTGSGAFAMPVFAAVDTAFYFEYVRYSTDPEEKKMLFWSSLVITQQDCWGFHTAFTHNTTQYKLMYSSLQYSDRQWVHLTPNWSSATQQKFTVTNSTNDGFFPAFSSASDTYTINQMVEAPANRTNAFLTPGYSRSATLAFPNWGVVGIDFFYTIRNSNGDRISRTFTVTAPMTNSRETDVYLFGDSGVGLPFFTPTDQQQTAPRTYQSIFSLVNEQRRDEYEQGKTPVPTSILHIGDISYSRGYGYLNEYFFQQIEPFSSRFPYQVSAGNHEICYTGQPWHPSWHSCGTDSGGEAGIPYYKRWEMPQDFCPSTTPHDCITSSQTQEYQKNGMRNIAYSYDVNSVHFIVFSLEHDFLETSAQYQFIERDLQRVDRTKTPWVIMAAHRPPYCTNQGCVITPNIPADQDPYVNMDLIQRHLFQPLMVKYGVDIGLWGHVHQYERFKPMGLGDYEVVETWVNPKTGRVEPVVEIRHGIETIKAVAPLHIVSGGAGNEFNSPWASYMKRIGVGYSERHHQMPDHVTFRTMNFGFSHFRANQTHLVGKWYSNQDTTLHDHFILEKV